MGRFGRREIDRAVAFEVTAPGEPLDATLVSVAGLWPDGGALSLYLTVSVTLTGYFRMEDDSIFEFSPSTTIVQPGPVLFTDAAPLDLELEWRPELTEAWLHELAARDGMTPAELELEHVLERFTIEVLGDAPVRAADFRWRRILQAQPSSPGTTVKAGLRSIWA